MKKKIFIISGIIIICIGLTYWLLTSFFSIGITTSSVMEPLIPRESIIMMENIHQINDLKRGDIVYWNLPPHQDVPQKTNTIGIIVGLPHEHIELKNGEIWIDDRQIHIEGIPYVSTESHHHVLESHKIMQKNLNLIIPKKRFYILALSNNALDSRILGTIPFPNIKNKVITHIKF